MFRYLSGSTKFFASKTTEEDAKKAREAFNKKFPEIHKWWQEIKSKLGENP